MYSHFPSLPGGARLWWPLTHVLSHRSSAFSCLLTWGLSCFPSEVSCSGEKRSWGMRCDRVGRELVWPQEPTSCPGVLTSPLWADQAFLSSLFSTTIWASQTLTGGFAAVEACWIQTPEGQRLNRGLQVPTPCVQQPLSCEYSTSPGCWTPSRMCLPWVECMKILSHPGETRSTFSGCYSKNNFRNSICLEIRVNGYPKHLTVYMFILVHSLQKMWKIQSIENMKTH